MDSPSFLTGRSAPERAAEPAAARPAPDVVRRPGRSPAPRPARPLANALPAAPVRVAKGTAALAVPAPGFDIESLITEDDEPGDMLSEKQQRLLTEPLYSFWAGPAAGAGFWPPPTWACFRSRAIRRWEGEFEGVRSRWLRWTDAQGELIPTGKERADQEAAARQAAEIRVQQEAAARRHEAAARQAAEARVAELEALLGRRST